MKDVYQLADLSSREILDAGADKPARLAVIGHPVSHSASPAMHQAALDAQGKDIRYIRLEVEPGQVAEALQQMKQLDFIGCNVTVPHKFEVMDCCDELSEDARAMGAVNTVIFGDQTLGHNTDAPGLVRAIREDFGIDLADLKVMIVGVGGGAGTYLLSSNPKAAKPITSQVRENVSPPWRRRTQTLLKPLDMLS